MRWRSNKYTKTDWQRLQYRHWCESRLHFLPSSQMVAWHPPLPQYVFQDCLEQPCQRHREGYTLFQLVDVHVHVQCDFVPNLAVLLLIGTSFRFVNKIFAMEGGIVLVQSRPIVIISENTPPPGLLGVWHTSLDVETSTEDGSGCCKKKLEFRVTRFVMAPPNKESS